MGRVVTDTSPLSALRSADLLALLPALFDAVLTTPEVQREYEARGDALPPFVKVYAAPRPLPSSPRLHAGEASAIALAQSLTCPAIFDDRAARTHAQQIGLPVVGTVGLVLRAKERGLLLSVAPALDRIRRDLYLSDDLVARVLRLAGER